MDYSLVKNIRSWSNAGAGMSAFILLAPVAWFTPNTGIKSPVAPFTNLGDQTTIKTAHEFIDGKGWLYLVCAPKKNKLDATASGDTGFVKLSQEANVYFPGNTPQLHETYQSLINVPLIALQKDANCSANLWMQLGCDCEGAYLGGPWNSGTTTDSAKGFNATISYDGPPMFYGVDPTPAIMAD